MTPILMTSPQINVHKHQSKHIDHFFELIKKISAVVVTVFAFYTNAPLFCAFFVLGGAIGLFHKIKELDACKHGGDSCSQGVFEQLSGVKLPRAIELIGGVFVLLVHIDHHPSVFIPLSGLYCGARFSKLFLP